MNQPSYRAVLTLKEKQVELNLSGDMEPDAGAVEVIKETVIKNARCGYPLVPAEEQEARFIKKHKIGEV